MGQYHYVVNLDKKEFLHPHKLGDGLKLMEFGASGDGTMAALAILLACACKGGPRGGGDCRPRTLREQELVGSWAGDHIAIVGDYSEDHDLPPEYRARTIYDRCHGTTYNEETREWEGHPEYRDISDEIRPLVEYECGITRHGLTNPY